MKMDEMVSHSVHDNDDFDPLDLKKLAIQIISGWRVLVVSLAFFSSVAVVYLNMTDEKFEAKVVIASTKGEDKNNALGRYSSLASMAGISFSVGGEGGFNKYESLLTSVDQMQVLIDNNPWLLRTVFKREWDEEGGDWREPRGVLSTLKSLVIRSVLNGADWQPPSAERLSKGLKEEIVVTKDPDTGFLTIIFENADAEFASWLVVALHRSADNLLRVREKVRTLQRIGYLSETLDDTQLSEQRAILIELLSDEQQKMMMIEADEDFVAEIVQFPVISTIPTQPRPKGVMFLACLVALAFGCFVILTFSFELRSFKIWR